MSDEKRQTRLLPFRLRRAGAARRGPAHYGAEDFGGPEGAEDFAADAELTALLRAWEAPPPGAGARARLLADFRAGVPRVPLWRRALAAELRVPLPVAACAALAVIASLFALGARGWTHAAPAVSKAEAAPVLKVVEVPVVQERVVTRTVYDERKGRGAGRVSASQAPTPPQAPTHETTRETLALGAGREEAGGQAAGRDSNAGYFTRVNMEDFQPADEVKIRVVKRGSTDER
jgi:hypothetical protein